MQAFRCVPEVRRRVAAERAFQQRGTETVALGRCDPRAATLLPAKRKSWLLTTSLDRPTDCNLPTRGRQRTEFRSIGCELVDDEGKALCCGGMRDNVMRLKGPKLNRNAIKATVNGFLRDAIRDIELALVRMRGEDLGHALQAQRQELLAIKGRLQSILDKAAE
jgi:hypothetical protein